MAAPESSGAITFCTLLSLSLLIFTSRFLINALKLQLPDYPVLHQFLIREDVDWAFLGHPSPPLSFPLSSPKQLPHHFWTDNWAQFPPNSQQEKWVLSTTITRNRFYHQLVSLSRDPGLGGDCSHGWCFRLVRPWGEYPTHLYLDT